MTTSEFPVFNNTYNITKLLGQGNTAKVYLGQAIDPKTVPHKVAIKILKSEFMEKDSHNEKSVMDEVRILESLNNEGVVGYIEHGSTGVILK